MPSTTLNDSYTRPADTTAYTANDAMADSTSAPVALDFGFGGSNGWLIGAHCVDGANASTLPQLRLFLFKSAPTPVNDNAAMTMTDADLLNCIAVLNFSTFVAGDDTSGAGGNAISFAALSDPVPVTGQVFGLVKVLNAYTPVSAEVFTFYLDIDLR